MVHRINPHLVVTVTGDAELPSAGIAIPLRMAIEGSSSAFSGLPISTLVIRDQHYLSAKGREILVRLEGINFSRHKLADRWKMVEAIGECLTKLFSGVKILIIFAGDEEASAVWT